MNSTNGRSDLLEQYGRFYGDEHFALAFTAGTTGVDAKRVTTKGWDQTNPVATGDFGAALLKGRGAEHNVAVVLRPSNLIVIECDSEDDLIAIEELDLPTTLTVQSSEPYKRHFYFRPPEALDAVPYVAFRFESLRVTADAGRYFLAPPSLHPSGVQYSFLAGLGPGDTDIVELPEEIYRALVERARREDSEQRERIAVDPDAKINAGQRRETLFRYACMLRRWGRPYEAILAECLQFNAERCDPPVAPELVEVQVKGAMKKDGDQELAQQEREVVSWRPLSATTFLELPEPTAGHELLGPLVLRGGRTIIGGDSGHGKTTLAYAIISAIVNGSDLLGWTGVGLGPALIIDLEQGVRSIKRGIREAQLGEDTFVLNLPDGSALDQNPQEVKLLEDVISSLQPTVVSIDPYYKAHRGDANEERAVTDLMRELDRLRSEYMFALLLPAHVRKDIQGGGVRKLTLADIAGSGAISRGAEIVLGLERLSHGQARLRYLKDREGDLPVGDAVDLEYSHEDGFTIKEGASSESIEGLIMAVEASGWMTVKEWTAEIGFREKETRRVLERLASANQIAFTIGPKGRSRTAKCYSTTIIPELLPEAGSSPEQLGAPRDDRATAPVLPTTPERGGSTEQFTVPDVTAPGSTSGDIELDWS